MEAATNYLVANNDDVELLKDSSFNVYVTANESFTGQEVESYLTTIIDNCKGIINSYDLSEEYARIGIVDLTLEDNAIKVDVIITRKLVSPYSASKWICHDGEEYPYSSTLLINSSGQQVIVPDFNCAGTSYVVMELITSCQPVSPPNCVDMNANMISMGLYLFLVISKMPICTVLVLGRTMVLLKIGEMDVIQFLTPILCLIPQ
jgi:hypothetical protein